MWYKLFIRYWTNEILVRYVKVSSKWDLFAVIGYLYSNTLERIDLQFKYNMKKMLSIL